MINLDKFFGSKGNFISATFRSEKKASAMHKGTNLEKRISGVFRAGISFENLSSVKEGIENGERPEVGSLPFGEWEKYPYIVKHTDKNGVFNRYVRLYPTPNCVLKVQYLVNGVESTKENFNSFLTPSDRAKAENGERPECIVVKVSNLISLGSEE
jgi:hypothetical protein